MSNYTLRVTLLRRRIHVLWAMCTLVSVHMCTFHIDTSWSMRITGVCVNMLCSMCRWICKMWKYYAESFRKPLSRTLGLCRAMHLHIWSPPSSTYPGRLFGQVISLIYRIKPSAINLVNLKPKFRALKMHYEKPVFLTTINKLIFRDTCSQNVNSELSMSFIWTQKYFWMS